MSLWYIVNSVVSFGIVVFHLFFFVPFLQGRTSASFMTPRRYIWVKMRKKMITLEVNKRQVQTWPMYGVSQTQSTLRIFYVIDIKWIHFNYIQFTLLLTCIWLLRDTGVQVWVYYLKYFSLKKCWWFFQFSFPQN